MSGKSRNTGFWLAILGQVAVVAGLVLVALQLNQNSELLRLQMIDQESQRYTVIELALTGENGAQIWQKVIEQPEELTYAEQRVAETILWTSFEAWRNSYVLHKAGLLGDEWKIQVATQAPYYLDHTYGRAWWRNLTERSINLPDALREVVEDSLEKSPNAPRAYHQGVMDLVRGELEKSQR